MLIDVFKNGTVSYVAKQKELKEVLDQIKNGDQNLDTIAELRRIGKQSIFFDDLKMKLPSFRFNFNFQTKATNENIKGATGLIYIDVDKMSEVLNTNKLIHASWKSISTTGYGIIVKIDGLTLENYPENYNAVSAVLGLRTDVGARKATQQTILSFDPNLYYNPDSTVFKAVSKKVSSTNIQTKEKELITLDDTFLERDELRFTNISDYFETDDVRDFIVFDKKERLCIPYIPNRIATGKRNQTMFFVLSQYALLNPRSGAQLLMSLAEVINQRFIESYSPEKISSIVGAVITKREKDTIKPWMNKERKIIFNPYKKLTNSEKQKIVGQQMGKVKTEKTLEIINAAIEDWNIEVDGKITQRGVADKIGKSLVTVKRNWGPFKAFALDLNSQNQVISSAKQKPSQIESMRQVEPLLSKGEIGRELFNILRNGYDGENVAQMRKYAISPSSFTDEEYNNFYRSILTTPLVA